MELDAFCGRLDDRLDHEAYTEVDASPNGLQVDGDGEITHAAFAVDAAVETIEQAAAVGADILVTHHGLFWGNIERVTGQDYHRVALLVENGIALYVSHLPLDGHQSLGNAAGIGSILDLTGREPFGSLGNISIGMRGSLDEPLPLDAVKRRLDDHLDTGASGIRVLGFGPDDVSEAAIVTGSGVDWLREAIDAGVDAFVTGEGKQQVYHEAKEGGINVVLAGHYATETFGVRSLASLAAEWGLDTTFIECPTGL